MGKRGTKPFPKIHHELNGNPGNRVKPDDPLTHGDLTAPEWLEGEALKKWNFLAGELHRTFGAAKVDSDVLAVYCVAWATFLQYKDSPAGIPGATGGMVTNPEARERNTAIANIRKYGAVLGLSPSDRVGMPSANAAESDPAAEFIA